MSKIAVVYWSGTGNTEQMANAVAEGAKEAGAEVSTLTADQFSAANSASFLPDRADSQPVNIGSNSSSSSVSAPMAGQPKAMASNSATFAAEN